MRRAFALALLAAVAGCASKPVSDPGGRWADKAEVLDNSLFR